MEQPTLVRKPIKEPINISSLLTQKHSYRSFQAGAIRGQTSIRYGSGRFSYPAVPLRPPTAAAAKPSLLIPRHVIGEARPQDDSGFRYLHIKQIINH